MNSTDQHQITVAKRLSHSLSRHCFTRVFLGGIVVAGSGLLGVTLAAPQVLAQDTTVDTTVTTDAAADLPENIRTEILESLSMRTGVPVSELRITAVDRKLIPNPCIGLAVLGGRCTRAVVQGYEVKVTNGTVLWTYYATQVGEVVAIKNAETELIAQATEADVVTTPETEVEVVEEEVEVVPVAPAPAAPAPAAPVPALW